MKRKMVATLALAGVLAAGAQAQEKKELEKPLRASLGLFFPNKGGGSRFALGGSYDFGKAEGRSWTYNTYLDFNSKKVGGATRSLLGVGVAVRSKLGESDGSYVGVGLGNYSLKAGGSNKNRLGGKLLYGMERKDGYFAEAAYTSVPRVNGVDASGFGLSVGYRF